MEYLAAWLVPGLGVAGLSIARGRSGFLWFLYVFLAWPLALVQLLLTSKRQETAAAEAKAPAPAPAPRTLDESIGGPAPELAREPLLEAASAPAPEAALIELELSLPPARDSLPASAEQVEALEGRGLDLAGHEVTYDQADLLEAAARYSEGVFVQETGQTQVPLPLQVEMINVILRDVRLSTQVRRWAIRQRGLTSRSAGQPEITRGEPYDTIAQAMVALAPVVAERLEAERAKRATVGPGVRFQLRLTTAPQGQDKVLARDLKRQMTIVYETLEGKISGHQIELAELRERDGLLYLRGYWGAALALRQISIDRIQSLTDLETGETPSDPEAYLRETFT